MNKGIWCAIGAYASWGVLPIYWKLIRSVPATQIIGHRIVWSLATVVVLILLMRKWADFRAALASESRGRIFRAYGAAALLIGVNWLIYVWAVNAGFIIETSLGYFINPLLSVAMGVVFFKERLRPLQLVSVALAGAGVLYLTVVHGSFPWIALSLSITFGLYGLVKKTAPLGSFEGLALETGILLVPAFLYLTLAYANGTGAFLHGTAITDILLAGAGIITTMPLIMFAAAARRIPLSLMGILQYISPTLQFLVGLVLYREPFSRLHFVGYGLVWLALILFAFESLKARQAAGAIMEPE
jgi:chloramphenicol-sensitive protein RarD